MFIIAGGRRDRVLFRNPSMLILGPDDVPKDADEVWYADCCPPILVDPCQGVPFRVFDHHVSNQKAHLDDERCTFDMNRSGTSLMAHVLGLQFISDRLVRALEAYDLGRFDEPDGVFLADLATSYTQEEMLSLLLDQMAVVFEVPSNVSRVQGLHATRDLYAQSAARSARYFPFKPPGYPDSDEFSAGLAFSPVYWKNAVSEEILKKADIAVIIDPVGGMVSLRSHTVDVSIIATAMGGGGHKRAAGFKLNGQSLMHTVSNEVFG